MTPRFNCGGALPFVAMAYLSCGVSGDISGGEEAKTSVSIFSM
jgi:hypothetical protein